MPQTRIQGKFYPLKSEEWLDSINQLTHSELKILYYVRSLDPYNNGINLSPAQIARDLSTEKNKMHRSTVGRALKFLDRQGFIKMELLQVRIKVNPKGFLAEEETTESKNVVTTQQCCDHATQSAPTQQLESENQSEQEVQNPKTLKTYSDFKKTLSEDERENFFNFVEEETKNLEKRINDLEAWLASKNAANQNRWEIYYSNYQKEKLKESAITNKYNQGSASLNVAAKRRAIAEFQKRMGIKQPINEPDAEEINSEEYQQRQAEFNKLLDNPPERDKSLAEQRRERIAEFKRQQEEIKRARREAALERAKQQNPDLEQRKQEMLREIEEFNQRQQAQNPALDEENLESE
jgi:Fe2+ or Zn2+ uptake regulation protein